MFSVTNIIAGHRGNVNITDCNQCTPGWYCEGYGLSEPTDKCARGYFCPGGQNTSQPVELACSPGHFCLEGSWNQTGCPSGYYQPHWRAYDCDICPQGSYCKAFGEYFSLIECLQMSHLQIPSPSSDLSTYILIKYILVRGLCYKAFAKSSSL